NGLYRGLMFLAESQLEAKAYVDAVATLDRAKSFAQRLIEEWQRLRLLSQVNEAADNLDAALKVAAQLKSLSTNDALIPLRSEATENLAGLLEKSGHSQRARMVWEENLATNVAIAVRSEALIHVAELFSREGDQVAARNELESYLQQNPTDSR